MLLSPLVEVESVSNLMDIGKGASPDPEDPCPNAGAHVLQTTEAGVRGDLGNFGYSGTKCDVPMYEFVLSGRAWRITTCQMP